MTNPLVMELSHGKRDMREGCAYGSTAFDKMIIAKIGMKVLQKDL